MQIIESSPRQKLSTLKVRVPDIDDEQVWIQSTISATHKLPRGLADEVSFCETDLVLITNRGGHSATCILEAVSCAKEGILIGSNRRGSIALPQGREHTILMRPGEVLTVRSLYAEEPGQRHADGSPVRIRNGQTLIPEHQLDDAQA